MKIEEAHNHLLNTVDGTARSLLGMWAEASGSGYNGLAAFFAYEHGERTKDLMNIAHHMAGQKQRVVFRGLDQPKTQYENPAVAIEVLKSAYSEIVMTAGMARESMIDNGENPYFIKDFLCKMEREMDEVKWVLEMVEGAEKEEMMVVNKKLMKKYA